MSDELLKRRDALTAVAAAGIAAAMATDKAVADEAPGGRITIHVLDLYSGMPANKVKAELYFKHGDEEKLLKTVLTSPSGRPETGPLISGEALVAGRYRIAFDLAEYFRSVDSSLPAKFFRRVTLEFEVTDPTMPHHIPLQCTPWTQTCSVLPG
ncbi:MAG: hydroxyisourate hydrolase [Geminicoccaceae bacterium]